MNFPPGFEQFIAAPILQLSAEFVTTPSKRDEAPLPKRPPAAFRDPGIHVDVVFDVHNRPVVAATPAATRRYKDALRHALLHETFHGIGRNYDERDAVHGNVELTVIKTKLTNGFWYFDCTVPFDQIKSTTKKMLSARLGRQRRARGGEKRKKGEAEDAEYFIRDSSLGIIGADAEQPTLAMVQTCRG